MNNENQEEEKIQEWPDWLKCAWCATNWVGKESEFICHGCMQILCDDCLSIRNHKPCNWEDI